ncbi:MAG TPA: hypothetical protein VMS17_09985 [Gemmataceae bacterium]|nr:hypothetical protein [Gemmataceae bacterium]
MSKKPSRTSARQLHAELVQMDRDIHGLREALQTMRARRAVVRARLTEARSAERQEAAGFAPDENRGVGGEG